MRRRDIDPHHAVVRYILISHQRQQFRKREPWCIGVGGTRGCKIGHVPGKAEDHGDVGEHAATIAVDRYSPIDTEMAEHGMPRVVIYLACVTEECVEYRLPTNQVEYLLARMLGTATATQADREWTKSICPGITLEWGAPRHHDVPFLLDQVIEYNC